MINVFDFLMFGGHRSNSKISLIHITLRAQSEGKMTWKDCC